MFTIPSDAGWSKVASTSVVEFILVISTPVSQQASPFPDIPDKTLFGNSCIVENLLCLVDNRQQLTGSTQLLSWLLYRTIYQKHQRSPDTVPNICFPFPNCSVKLKYFKAGLEWLDKYNMKNVLDKAGLYPDTNTSTDLTTIWLGIKTGLGVNPSIHCIHDKKTGQYYLQEIRICFDKSLQLTDCDGIRSRRMFRWQPLGNCPNEKPIFYPNTIPPRSRKPLPPPPDNSVISLLKVIQFVMWLTS
ncbi:ribonuclease T2 activity protein [Homalodisca vitripennis]|nr:ribonuclease T2 activity protein [Homalodisca vitripennis]